MKTRIAFISEHASPLASLGGTDTGGQNVYVAELAVFLSKNKYDIDIFTRWDNPELPLIINWMPGIRIIHIKAGTMDILPKEELLPHMPEFRENMVSFISAEKIKYGLIHANFWMSALVASQLKEIFAIPFVVTFHALGQVRLIYQGNNDKFPPERISIEKDIVRKADRIIAECPQDKEDLINYYNTPSFKISIIPCGFNPGEFYPVNKALARKKLNLNAEDHILLQLGRMVPRKGVDNVIRSLAKFKPGNKPIRLVIVGGETENSDTTFNSEIARLKNIAREEGVLNSILFAGRKDRDILKFYYSAADVFITTPWYEPFGITPLEAMACGLPVVGSNVGGIKYSVVDGVTGFLVPANDPQALATKVNLILTDINLHTNMKAQAIKRVNSEFTWAHVADKVDNLYDYILCYSKQTSMQTQSVLNRKTKAA